MDIFLVALLIFIISMVFSMLGLGGGLVYVPLFFFLGFPVHIAISTSLLLNGLTTLSAAVTYIKKGLVDFRLAAPLIISSGIGAPAGAYTTAYVDIKIILGLVAATLIFGAAKMWLSSKMQEGNGEVNPWRKILSGTVIGLSIGFMAGLLGVGGGIFMVPLLIFALKIPTRMSAATTAFIVVFSSFIAFITHYSIGHFDLSFALPAALCAVIGGQIGSRIMVKQLSGIMIRRLFSVVLLALAIKLIHRLVVS